MNPPAPQPRVLVVDDEENLRELVRVVLEEQGFAVETAGSGEEALQKALSTDPDVILLDVQLGDTDGFALCRRMREKNILRNKPILMLTAQGTQEDELRGLKAGADDYLTKPIDAERLSARVQSALRRNTRELDANPLTRLPGNTSILQELDNLLRAEKPFAVVFGDLNNFKAFNDRYGFLRGDQAIKMAADCFSAAVENEGEMSPSFVGHIGGDDFVAIVDPLRVEAVCRAILARFEDRIPFLYDEEDRLRGTIRSRSRQGLAVEYPLTAFALAVVRNTDRAFKHPGEISSLAMELKTYAKTFKKNIFVFDRRGGQTS